MFVSDLQKNKIAWKEVTLGQAMTPVFLQHCKVQSQLKVEVYPGGAGV